MLIIFEFSAELQRSVRSLSTDRDSALKDADRKQMRIVDLEDQLRDIELRSSGDDCQHCIELQHAIDKITQKLAQVLIGAFLFLIETFHLCDLLLDL